MSNKKLYYFDTFGLGESIRYLLHYGGIKFEDIKYSSQGFLKDKPRVAAVFIATDAVKKAALKTKIETELTDFYFSRFEKEMKANGGHFAGKLTWVDFVLVGLIEATNHFLGLTIEKNYPAVTNLLNKVHNLPSIKSYVASRKPYSI